MVERYIKYLSKFGSERIKDYTKSLLVRSELNDNERNIVSELSEYYKSTNDPRLDQFCNILTTHNLWYTLYL